ncbi:class I SAM-dependent methyltransferase [Ancylobacter oerskovii]|uniref:Class I SAM-dependent methyltransferase n=1 Tax=Ancylobacter oerskovii TaxID=459519 RepID=A0ABW4YUJ7_9HYPH|nr:class I SAM-dependent methyltransferase [Ancylobacter oerskovii]MBS7544494.1 class I SAM-dependent methyltransferase [Ancylobacter oerskovii]
MYDVDWHRRHEARTEASADRILSLLRAVLPFETALDVGCGDGIWLQAAQRLGVGTILGVDGPWTDVARLRIPADAVRIVDLERPFDLGRTFDLAICLEVAEHVSHGGGEQLVRSLTRHSDLILFGAAIPFQGGFRHINEQWQSYWVGLFKARSFRHLDLIRPQVWNQDEVHFWYKQNALVYINERRPDLIALAEAYRERAGLAAFPTDMVYPDLYLALASYERIAFRPLLNRLPARAMSKFLDIVQRRI